MTAPRLSHDDPELEPLSNGATPDERELRWAELARRLGSALARWEHALPLVRSEQANHETRLDGHDLLLAEIVKDVGEIRTLVEQLASDASAAGAKLPA
jgi:hypothetical protein